MSEAALTATASQLRHLFAAILAHSVPSDPERLWRNHDFDLCEDYLNAERRVRPHGTLLSTSPSSKPPKMSRGNNCLAAA